MKKLIMMMALAVGLTGFAAQNDKLVSFYTNGPDTYADGTAVVDGECYALVWVKTGAFFGGFNADGSAADSDNNAVLQISACAKGGKCDGVLFHVAAERDAAYANTGTYQVYLMDTRDAAGVPSAVTDGKVARVNGCGLCPAAQRVVSGAVTTRRAVVNLTAAGIEPEATFERTGPDAYADGAQLTAGERYLLVGRREGAEGGFRGVTWDCALVDSANDKIVKILTTANVKGGCDAVQIGALTAGYVYQVIVLDTRLPGGNLSGEITFNSVDVPRFNSGWGELTDTGSVLWHSNKLGASAFLKQFDFDPSPFLAEGYAAIHDEDGEQVRKLGLLGGLYGLVVKDSWMVFPYPKAVVTQIENKVLKPNDNYSHLRAGVQLPAEFALESTYLYDSFANEAERTVVQAVLTDKDITKSSFNLTETLLTIEGGNTNPQSLKDLSEGQMAFLDWYMRNVPFFGWNCDFVVSFSEGVEKDSFVLAGFYDYMSAWSQYAEKFPIGSMEQPWIGSSSENDLASGEPFRLLKSYQDGRITVNYSEICTKVKTFQCGVYNASSNNWGKTISVRLNLYPNYGRDNEDGRSFTVDTQRYTFKGPLNVKFYEDNVEREGLAISTNHDGTCEILLPALKGGNTTAFVGWSNQVADVVYTNSLPAHTWTPDGTRLELYAAWRAAQVVVVSNATSQVKDQDIKVTDDWIKDVLKVEPTEKDAVQKKLNEPVGTDTEKGTMKKWEAYVLGLDATDPNASVKVDQTAGAQEDKAIVLSTVQAPPPDSGFKVAFSLDKVEDNEETVKKTVDERTTNDLTIDLEPTDGDTPTGYYKMNVIVTPDGADPIKYPAENTIGVLKVESEEKLLPVAVPWLSLEAGSEVMPDEIVDPRTLSENDQLHVWQESVGGQQNIYISWHVEGGKWIPNPTVKLNADMSVNTLAAAQAREGSVGRGRGVWLQRKDPTKPFYLVGQYKQEEKASVEIRAPEGDAKAEYNLIAPTGIEETDLNEVITTGVGENDKLMTVNNGHPTYYSYSDGKWGYNKQVLTTTASGRVGIRVVRETNVKAPAGIGLWYISEGGKPTINWNK